MPRAELAGAAVAAALALLGCGDEVPAGGVPRVALEAPARRLVPDELVPGHLELVVRFDLERMHVALGDDPQSALGARLGDEPLVLRALGKARSALLALRSASLEAGDHVLVLEGDFAGLAPDEQDYAPVPSSDERVRLYLRRSSARRAGTEAIVVVGGRILAFASPLEADALLRVAQRGPDAARGAPVAEGLVSVDFRPKRLDPRLERRFPSVARLVAQTERVRAKLGAKDDGLRVEAEVLARAEPGAERIARFLEALRAGATGEAGASSELGALVIEPVGRTVHLSMPLDAAAVLRAFSEPRPER